MPKRFISLMPMFILDYISKGHERSVKAKRNIFFSFLIKGGSIAISLVLVPLTIHYINPMRYGIWLTLSSIIGWFSFFDIGFGNGLRNKFAEAVAKGEDKLARIYVSTTYAILSIISMVVLLLFFLINPFLNWARILNTSPEMAVELSSLALIVFTFFCVQFVLQLVTTIIIANQQPAKASFINFLGSLFSLVLIFVLSKISSGNLIYLGLSLGLAPVVVLLISSVWLYSNQYKKYAPSLGFVKFNFASDLMGLGLKFFIIQIAAIVLYQTSNIIIAQLFGPEQVTPYNIAFKYFAIIPMVLSIIMTPFWSAFTEAWIRQDILWIKNTMRKLQIMWVILCIAAIIMLVISDYIFGIWVGKNVVVPFSVSASMAAYVILNSWNGIYSQFLNGVGKIKLQLYGATVAMLLNIPMAILGGKLLGISGVILSTVIMGMISIGIMIVQYKKIINNKAKGIWAA